MNDFFNSKLIRDLKNGVMPVFPVSIERKTVIDLGVMLTMVVIIAILVLLVTKKALE
jgi:hypothetical protein